MMMGPDGKVTTIAFGPGRTLRYTCENVTMEAFAAAIRGMLGNSIDTDVIDDTGLKGTWSFDVTYSFNFAMMNNSGDDMISFPVALEKQLGLGIERRPIPPPF